MQIHKLLIRPFTLFGLVLGLAMVSNTALAAQTADGFAFPTTTTVMDVNYKLCSSSDSQVYFFLDIGDVALYLKDCTRRPPLDQKKLLYFYYNHDFTAKQLRDSAWESLKKNLSDSTFTSLQQAIKDFNQLYQSVEAGDTYQLGVNAQGLMALYLNGDYLGQSDSRQLSRVYFRIWLGKHPLSEDVKATLLDLH